MGVRYIYAFSSNNILTTDTNYMQFKGDTYDIKPARPNPSRLYVLREGMYNKTIY